MRSHTNTHTHTSLSGKTVALAHCMHAAHDADTKTSRHPKNQRHPLFLSRSSDPSCCQGRRERHPTTTTTAAAGVINQARETHRLRAKYVSSRRSSTQLSLSLPQPRHPNRQAGKAAATPSSKRNSETRQQERKACESLSSMMAGKRGERKVEGGRGRWRERRGAHATCASTGCGCSSRHDDRERDQLRRTAAARHADSGTSRQADRQAAQDERERER